VVLTVPKSGSLLDLRCTHPLPRGGSDCAQVWISVGYSQNHLAVAGGCTAGRDDFQLDLNISQRSNLYSTDYTEVNKMNL